MLLQDEQIKTSNQNVLELKGLFKSFQTESGTVNVLNDISLKIGHGELVGIFGKSGSGKSTLLNMITGIDKPTKGDIWMNHQPINCLIEKELAVFRGNHMGIVFQFFQLLPMLTVRENIMLAMDFTKKYPKNKRIERTYQLLKELGIDKHADKFPTSISGGEQQRVAIARALANDPEIIIADEPTGNLDSNTSKAIFQIFKKQISLGKTVIIVTHDISSKNEFSRIIEISDGRIVNEVRKENLL